jgi:hypothetical protein
MTETSGNYTVKNDMIKPNYYIGRLKGIEVSDVILDFSLGWHLGNAVKYILRAGKKNPQEYIEDLQKAITCIQMQINTLIESQEDLKLNNQILGDK